MFFIIYLLNQLLFINLPILNLINKKNLSYLFVTLMTLCGINYLMFLKYDWEFIENSYLYHFSRLDHRHNFSIYNMVLYYKSSLLNGISGLDIEKLAFIPQLLISGLIIPLVFAKMIYYQVYLYKHLHLSHLTKLLHHNILFGFNIFTSFLI